MPLSITTAGPRVYFPATHWSLLLDGKRRPQCLAELAKEYWKPVYAYILKSGHERETAQDLTQELFIELMESDALDKINRNKGNKFRTYLLAILQNLIKENARKQKCQKRNPGRPVFSLEMAFNDEDEKRILAPAVSPEDIFGKEWAHAVVQQALSQLESYCQNKPDRQQAFSAFALHFLHDKDTGDIARELARDTAWVSEKIYRLKHLFSKFVKQVVQESLAEGENVEDEIKEIMAYLK